MILVTTKSMIEVLLNKVRVIVFYVIIKRVPIVKNFKRPM